MSPLIETIRIENKQLQHINRHNQRMNHALKYYFKASKNVILEKMIDLPGNLNNYRYKCRVEYTNKDFQYSIFPYQQKTINTLKIIENTNIEYRFKYSNRDAINALMEKKEEADDIIITQNGRITDSSYCNLLLFNGKEWHTPSIPLLKGIQRSFLIDSGIIFEKEIHQNNLLNYVKIKLINAMIDFQRAPEIPIENITNLRIITQ